VSHIPLVDPATVSGTAKEHLDQIQATFGTVPAMFRAVAHSPATLASMWGAFGAFGAGTLGPALSEQIAVAVANHNSCKYCLAAHTALGRKAGVTREAMAAAQTGTSTDPRDAALLAFALKLVDRRGQVTAEDLRTVRDIGWNDEQVVEVIGQVALNLFTNYVNLALDVPVDFPDVPLR